MNQDTNFDDLTEHFQKRIYGSRKGKIRLAVLQRDLEQHVPAWAKGGLKVIDVGAGLGQMGLQLAGLGHDVCINDISANMLAAAKQTACEQDIEKNIQWSHAPFQDLEAKPYDLVLCHAVLEWLEKPESFIAKLHELTHADSLVSLMFYNKDALVFHNLVRGNFKKINNNDFSGMKGGLTPPNPLQPTWVEDKLNQHGFETFYRSGIRVFSDYVGMKRGGNEHEADVLSMELRYSQHMPYVLLGRYVHVMCRRK